MKTNRRYRCALITGASSGLGAEYARQLVSACDTMVLVARRGQLMKELADQLNLMFPDTEIHCITTDLSSEKDREGLFEMLQAMALAPDLLVNNAGLGDYGPFSSSDWSKINSMLQVNMTALTHLCHGFLPGMISQGRGSIINVSSLAGALPMPDFAAYAASKAYVTSFSDALRMELREIGIPVLAVCPGPVHTNFGKVAIRASDVDSLPSREGFYTEPEQVVSDSICALHADKARVYPGWKIALMAASISILPMAILRTVLTNLRGQL